MRTLLINAPVARTSIHSKMSPPLGIAYVAAAARTAGHRVELLDLNVSGLNPQRLAAVLDRVRPDVVGISAHTETYPNALRIAHQAKDMLPDARVVLGGAHPSIAPEAVLAEPDIDFVAIGEGERTFVELLDALSADAAEFSAIAGLGWKKDGRAVMNTPRTPMHPDEIGLPARDLLPLAFYDNAFNVLTARGGCPYKCPFCSASYIWSGAHRQRTASAVVDEVEMLVREYGARFIFFVDDILTLDRRWMDEFLAELPRLGGVVSWGCATRVDRVDEDLLSRMAACGCTGIQFGVESGSQTILDSVKGIKKQRALDAVRWAIAAGINAGASFMVPFPDDTPETLRETFEFMQVLRNEGAEIMMSFTTPYPGTLFYERAEELGIHILTDDWAQFDAKHVVMETRMLDAATIESLVESETRRLGLIKST